MIYSLSTFHLFQGITQTLNTRAVKLLSQETIHDVNLFLIRLKVKQSVYMMEIHLIKMNLKRAS